MNTPQVIYEKLYNILVECGVSMGPKQTYDLLAYVINITAFAVATEELTIINPLKATSTDVTSIITSDDNSSSEKVAVEAYNVSTATSIKKDDESPISSKLENEASSDKSPSEIQSVSVSSDDEDCEDCEEEEIKQPVMSKSWSDIEEEEDEKKKNMQENNKNIIIKIDDSDSDGFTSVKHTKSYVHKHDHAYEYRFTKKSTLLPIPKEKFVENFDGSCKSRKGFCANPRCKHGNYDGFPIDCEAADFCHKSGCPYHHPKDGSTKIPRCRYENGIKHCNDPKCRFDHGGVRTICYYWYNKGKLNGRCANPRCKYLHAIPQESYLKKIHDIDGNETIGIGIRITDKNNLIVSEK